MTSPELGWTLITIGVGGFAGLIWWNIENHKSRKKQREIEDKSWQEWKELHQLKMESWKKIFDEWREEDRRDMESPN